MAVVHLVKGSDDVLRGGALTTLVDELVGQGDRSLLVDEFDLDGVKLGAALDAAQTIPFLTDRRIVVVRRFGRFSKAEEITDLVTYLEDPLESTTLVLVWERALGQARTAGPDDPGESVAKAPRIPPALTKAVTAAGGDIVDADPKGRNLDGWIGDQFRAAGLDLDGAARKRVTSQLGEDTGALIGLIERLKGAYGPGTRLGTDQVDPFLGAAGGVPPWDLTDAIDKGDVPGSLDLLHRMMGAGERHPLAIMASLQSHYSRMVRLDGANARSEKEAAQVLGLKGSTFPAKKAMNQVAKLGRRGTQRALTLVAGADADLRGARAWPGELVMEVLVARLATLSRSAR